MIGKIASCIKATVRCSNVIFAWSITYSASNFATAALIVIPAPPSVQPGAIQSQTDAVLFLESVSTLASPLAVDIAAPGALYKCGAKRSRSHSSVDTSCELYDSP